MTTDALGCTPVNNVVVETDADPITARYLVATFANVGDTLHFVQPAEAPGGVRRRE